MEPFVEDVPRRGESIQHRKNEVNQVLNVGHSMGQPDPYFSSQKHEKHKEVAMGDIEALLLRSMTTKWKGGSSLDMTQTE